MKLFDDTSSIDPDGPYQHLHDKDVLESRIAQMKRRRVMALLSVVNLLVFWVIDLAKPHPLDERTAALWSIYVFVTLGWLIWGIVINLADRHAWKDLKDFESRRRW